MYVDGSTIRTKAGAAKRIAGWDSSVVRDPDDDHC
jgi:hypothetical protein